VIGEDAKSVTFFSVVKLLWVYIKEHNLQNGRNIVCDDKLRAVFGRDEVGSFHMAKFIGQHLLPQPNQSVGTIVQPDLTPKPKADKPAKAAKRKKAPSDKPARVVPEESKCFVSTQVAAVIGKERATFFELTKLFWVYIKANNLQSPESKTVILCDDKLKAVFGVDRIGSFTMSKYFKQHLLEKGAAGPREITVVQPPPSAPKERGQAKKKAKVSKSTRTDADSDDDDDGNVDDVVESEGEAAADDDDDDDDDDGDDDDEGDE
jgi:chromatin remodeling complex protein RSC6